MASSPRPGRIGLAGRSVADHGVRIVDTPAARVHHPGDLLNIVLVALGIGAVLLLAVYAQGTTTGVTEDVQSFDPVVQRILFLPVAVLESLLTFLVPVAVLTELVLRRLVRHAFEAVAAAIAGVLVALLASWLITRFGVDTLRIAFGVFRGGERVVTVPALLTATAALLTVAGARGRRRTVGGSWNALWLVLGIALITGLVTLPGALLTVLLGRLVGLTARYASGVQTERAYGAALVDGVRRAGFEPTLLTRVSDDEPTHADGAATAASAALARQGDARVYAMTTTDGRRFDVVVLDGDRQVVGLLQRSWRSLRLRGIEGRAVVSLRQAAERTALLSYAASAAGVRTPLLLGIAEADDSMLLVQEHPAGTVPLRDVPAEELSDDVLDAVWEQLRGAHKAGLAHRALTSDVVLLRRVGARTEAMLTGWASGDVASSELARRMDVSQLLAVLALRVGAERAVASAARVLSDEELATTGPLLQAIALPRATREEARQNRGVLAEVREALLARLPEADVEPERLVRFGARTVLTVGLTIAAVVVVTTSINFEQIRTAVTTAEPWWAAVSFGLGLLTFFGSALTLAAFSPVKLPLWRATLVQCAAAFVALAAPAGVGPAALNLRMLTRRGASNALAVASVGLVQVSQLLTTILLLLVMSLLSGSGSNALELPSTTVLATVGILLLAAGVAMLVPPVREWVARRTVPLWRQTWPRLVQMLSQPRRFAVAVAGNLLMTLSYLGAFAAALAAFGVSLSPIDLALIYLLGNAAGALVPTPGGLGSVEGALITGLTGAGGLGAAIATAAVFLFRALTFWARVPFGWLAMRALQRTGEL